MTADEFFKLAAGALAAGEEQRLLLESLRAREAGGSTVLAPGLAMPHITASAVGVKPLLAARARQGLSFPGEAQPVHAVFTLVRLPGSVNSDLQTLAAVARIASRGDFADRWRTASGVDELRNLLLEGSGDRV
jgi:mannitol/fructose-specific phosphotransferase system IIA component (Ntr-type)